MYATLADILEQVAEDELIALTDDEQLGSVDVSAVDRAISNGMAVIDAHCGGRYAVPFSPVPDLVRLYTVDLAVFNLYSRRTHLAMPDVVGERQKQALAFLRLVQKGEASVGIPPTATPANDVDGATFVAGERLFTRDKLRGL